MHDVLFSTASVAAFELQFDGLCFHRAELSDFLNFEYD